MHTLDTSERLERDQGETRETKEILENGGYLCSIDLAGKELRLKISRFYLRFISILRYQFWRIVRHLGIKFNLSNWFLFLGSWDGHCMAPNGCMGG